MHIESNGIEVKTTDSGYMSPPEVHLDGELNGNSGEKESQSMDVVMKELAELHVSEKSTSAETELETFNSFNYWRMPLPEIEGESAEQVNEKQEINFEERKAHPSENDVEEKTSELNDDNGQKSEPRLEFQDLGISDMDVEENSKDVLVEHDQPTREEHLSCDKRFDSSTSAEGHLTGVPSLRFDEDYLQPYSPNMSFEEETPSAPDPPRSPKHRQVSV